jgi:hypothetical protein
MLLRVVEQRLRAHSPGAVTSARFGAVAFIHRFGSFGPEVPMTQREIFMVATARAGGAIGTYGGSLKDISIARAFNTSQHGAGVAGWR